MSDDRKAKLARRRAFTREFYRGNMPMLLISCFWSLLSAGVYLLVSVLLQQVMDAAAITDMASLRRTIPLVLGLIGAIVLLVALGAWCEPRFRQRACLQFKQYAFRRLTEKGVTNLKQERTARYISGLTNDVTAIETQWLAKPFEALALVVSFIGALALMLLASPLLTAWAVGFTLLPLVAAVVTSGMAAGAQKRVSATNEGFVAMTKDMLEGFPVIRAFQAENEAATLFDGRNQQLEKDKRRLAVIQKIIGGLGEIAGYIAQFGVFGVGAYMAVTGQGVSVGVLIMFVQLMNYIVQPIAVLPQIFAGRQAAMALVDKLAEALEEDAPAGGVTLAPTLSDAIRLEDVSFAYEEGKPVLTGVTATLEAGRRYAIVGASGSGKSTLLSLLTGENAASAGRITFDGTSLEDASPDSLAAMMGHVQQSVFIFDDDIRRNITMFRDFPEEEVQDAIRRSGLTDLIARRGLDAPCGENGANLSGGEKQRISIARCILRRASVLLMDEATAALDAATAREVMEAILALEGMTRIVVTHRLEAPMLRQFDEILVMRGGRIDERGSFDELMAQDGYFRSLYRVSQG